MKKIVLSFFALYFLFAGIESVASEVPAYCAAGGFLIGGVSSLESNKSLSQHLRNSFVSATAITGFFSAFDALDGGDATLDLEYNFVGTLLGYASGSVSFIIASKLVAVPEKTLVMFGRGIKNSFKFLKNKILRRPTLSTQQPAQ